MLLDRTHKRLTLSNSSFEPAIEAKYQHVVFHVGLTKWRNTKIHQPPQNGGEGRKHQSKRGTWAEYERFDQHQSLDKTSGDSTKDVTLTYHHNSGDTCRVRREDELVLRKMVYPFKKVCKYYGNQWNVLYSTRFPENRFVCPKSKYIGTRTNQNEIRNGG